MSIHEGQGRVCALQGMHMRIAMIASKQSLTFFQTFLSGSTRPFRFQLLKSLNGLLKGERQV